MFDVNFVDKATFTSLHNWVLLKKIILAITESILLIMRSSQSWVFEESFWYFLKSVLKRLKISPSLSLSFSITPSFYHSHSHFTPGWALKLLSVMFNDWKFLSDPSLSPLVLVVLLGDVLPKVSSKVQQGWPSCTLEISYHGYDVTGLIEILCTMSWSLWSEISKKLVAT